MAKSPCKDCEDRTINCHSTCREYKAWKFEKDRLNDINRKRKQIDTALTEAMVKNCIKARRKNRW